MQEAEEDEGVVFRLSSACCLLSCKEGKVAGRVGCSCCCLRVGEAHPMPTNSSA